MLVLLDTAWATQLLDDSHLLELAFWQSGVVGKAEAKYAGHLKENADALIQRQVDESLNVFIDEVLDR